jgi:hypothetical protein
MAALVQFLAAGVNGAANGTATFVLRGTASSAASVLYNDFEQTAQPGTNIITLDANGAAEVYTDAYVDVTLKNSAGSTLRTVTFGNAATTVEVISDSFTGTDYSGSPSGVNEPITLAAVLNKWDNSAGADDWQVAVNGVATNLSAAISAFAGIFFNVKDPTYGALGDGATDDTNAVNAAVTAAVAAGGGIVYFPPSTSFYNVTSLSISAENITLMGAGPLASVIKSSTTSTTPFSFTNSTVNAWKRVIGLGLQGTGANANPLIALEDDQNVLFHNCHINASTYTSNTVHRSSDAGLSHIIFRDCSVIIGASSDTAFANAAGTDGETNFVLDGCRITIPASFTGTAVLGPDFHITNCVFDASAQTTGSYYHINATSNAAAGRYRGTVSDCTFIDGNSGGKCFDLRSIATASDFSEFNNTFVGFTAPTTFSGVGTIYDVTHAAHDAAKVFLGSRRGRSIEVTHASTGAVTASVFTSYETVFVNYTGAGNLSITLPVTTMVKGAQISLSLLNNSGAQRDIVLKMGVTEFTVNATTDGGAAGTDVTKQPNDQEIVFAQAYYTEKGSGHPYCVLTTAVED